MRRVFAFLLSLGLMTAGSLPAQTNHLDLKGKQIKLSILGVAGWLPSKLPSDMFPEFAKYAKEKYGYDVTCTYADAPFGALFQKAAASLATKSNEYSLIVSDSQWLGAFTEPGWIVKLDPIIKSDPVLSKLQWYNPVLETSYMEYPDNSGQHVALPQETDVEALFVRKDLFQDPKEREAYKQLTGNDLPQTFEDWEKVDFDEFAKISKFFTRPDKNLYGTVFQHSKEYDFQSMYVYPFMWSMGGEFWDPKTHDTEGYLDTDTNAKAMEHQKTFVKYEPPGALNYGIAENIDAFTQGKTATSIMWAAVGLAMITDQNRDKVMVVPPPGIKQADGTIKRLYCIGGQAWVVNNYATPEQKQAIFDFLKWWYLPETQLEFAKKGGNPAVKEVLEDPSFDAINPWNRAMKYMIPFNRDFYHSPKYAELLAIQQEAFCSYVTGSMNDPMKALHWAAARQQQVFHDLGDTKKKANPAYLKLQLN
jgi:multiple sugar transport system substrate-binding protein